MTDTSKKRPGIFHDPWRATKTMVPTRESVPPPVEEPPSTIPIPEDNGQDETIKKVQIQLANYGGLTITGTDSSAEAAKLILEFCIKYLKNIENTLLQYGIIVVKLSASQPLNAVFYIRRSDGWVLAVPEARTRDQGLLQLIQAFLALQVNPGTKQLLQQYHIQPHKI